MVAARWWCPCPNRRLLRQGNACLVQIGVRERRLKRRRRCSGGHSLLSTVFVVAGLISSRNNRGIPGQKRTLCSGSSSELITFLRRALSPLLFHVRLSVNDTRRWRSPPFFSHFKSRKGQKDRLREKGASSVRANYDGQA